MPLHCRFHLCASLTVDVALFARGRRMDLAFERWHANDRYPGHSQGARYIRQEDIFVALVNVLKHVKGINTLKTLIDGSVHEVMYTQIQ